MRVVIDTNLWISFIISKKINLIEKLILENTVTIIFSKELITEIENSILKPKLQKLIKDFSFVEMLLVFIDFIEMIETKSNILICRDLKDNFLLNLATDGNADYLITGDKDLLILKKINNTKIITIADFKLIL